MTSMCGRWFGVVARILVVGVMASPPSASAQGEQGSAVFFTQPNNRIVKVLGFEDEETEVVVFEPGRNFQGLAVRQDGLLVVANKTQGGTLEACTPDDGMDRHFDVGGCERIVKFKGARAVALDFEETLFAVNATKGGRDQVLRLVRDGCAMNSHGHVTAVARSGGSCLPGGYSPDVEFVDENVGESRELADLVFLPGGFGGVKPALAVLSQDPPAILIYDPDSSNGPEEIIDFDPSSILPHFRRGGPHGPPRGVVPTTIASDPFGAFFVGTSIGEIVKVDADGEVEEFVGTIGEVTGLTVGLVRGTAVDFKLYVSVRPSRVERYALPSGAPDGDVFGVSPNGVATPSSGGYAPLQEGTGVQITHSAVMTTFDEVLEPSVSLFLCDTVVDPRETGEGGCEDGDAIVLCTSSTAGCPAVPYGIPHCVHDLEIPRVIPGYIEGIPALGPGGTPQNPTGAKLLRICQADVVLGDLGGAQTSSTGPLFEGLITDFSEEELFLGYSPECHRPRMAYATDGLTDTEITEGSIFTDISIDCGSNLGAFKARSVILPAVFDTRSLLGEEPEPVPAVAARTGGGGGPFVTPVEDALDCSKEDGILPCKFAHLSQTLNAAGRRGLIHRRLFNDLREKLDEGIDKLERGKFCPAARRIHQFERKVEKFEDNSTAFPDPQVAAELSARSMSIFYMLTEVDNLPADIEPNRTPLCR